MWPRKLQNIVRSRKESNMAEIVLGIGTSHSPVLSMPPEGMPAYAEGDRRNKQLLRPPTGTLMTYDELEAAADATTRKEGSAPDYEGQFKRYTQAIDTLAETVAKVKPDVFVMFGDDQEELFFDDNMPAVSIYWGDTMPWIPRSLFGGRTSLSSWGYGDKQMDYPIDSDLARFLIDSLMEADFDVAQTRYLNEKAGGHVGPAGYVSGQWDTEPREQGMIHAYGFVCKRIMHESMTPIVPITQNTCYPPNQITPRRSYALGRAVRRAIEDWDTDKRVAIVGTGGLSHFVVDEELDRMVLNLMRDRNAEGIASLPKERLNSATSEIRNWIAAAGALEHLDMELIDYIPARRTPAGTGGGWGFARWQ
jgi:3-O-methylgallate 3,4-dioxygenase